MGKIGFIGMGVMGEPMAGHLVNAGNEVVVWNRSAGKTNRVSDLGATVADSIEDLAADCEIIISCVGTSNDVREVVLRAAKVAKPGTLIIDHSTIEPKVAQEIASELEANDIEFVDAPITGGSMGAQKGTLTVFLGGSESAVSKAIEIIKPYSKRSERVGPSGSGQMMKLANQIAVGGALIGLSESLAFAKKAGLDLNQAHSMIGSGAGGSWAFENYGPKILNQDWTPGFSVKNQRKDFGYCESSASELGIEVPMTELVNRLLGKLAEIGRNEDTTAALYDVYLSEK